MGARRLLSVGPEKTFFFFFRDVVNAWVEEKTHKKIQKLLTPSQMAQTEVVLVNAVYFKASWAHPFKEGQTRKRPFTSWGRTLDVWMMQLDEKLRFTGPIDSLGAAILELPYLEDSVSMLIILPTKIEGLREVEDRLSELDFVRLQFQQKVVAVQLPRFKVRLLPFPFPFLLFLENEYHFATS